MTNFYYLLLITILLSTCTVNKSDYIPDRDRVLFITTNIDNMGGADNGTYLIEIAVPFGLFLDCEVGMDFLSPEGGAIPIYHSGDTTDRVKEILRSPVFKDKRNNTLRPLEVNPANYAAVIIPGGYGQFWDVHQNPQIQRIVAEVYEAGGFIGSIGHGTATLIDVKLSSGEYLVAGKTIACFPSWYEKNSMEQSDYGNLLPYDMEIELQNRGADLKIYDRENRTNYEIIDSTNRLITASFASGAQFVAEEILKRNVICNKK